MAAQQRLGWHQHLVRHGSRARPTSRGSLCVLTTTLPPTAFLAPRGHAGRPRCAGRAFQLATPLATGRLLQGERGCGHQSPGQKPPAASRRSPARDLRTPTHSTPMKNQGSLLHTTPHASRCSGSAISSQHLGRAGKPSIPFRHGASSLAACVQVPCRCSSSLIH